MKVLVGKKHPLAREPPPPHAPRHAGARLETESFAEAELLQKALETGADAIVVDARLAGAAELATWSLEPADPLTLVLCLHPGIASEAPGAILATACAYFLATGALDEVEHVVRDLHGRRCLGAVPRAPALARVEAPLRDELSAREKQILALLALEKTSKEIATQLGVSSRTVDSHRSNLIKKLGVHSTVGLACYAVGAGLVRP